MSEFVGRGENTVQYVIQRLYKFTETWTQVPLLTQISAQDFSQFGEEFSKHKFDIVSKVENSKGIIETLVLEVNFKHKEKAAKKWRIFAAALKNNNKTPVTIDDYDCRKKGLFYLNSKKEHVLSWDDFRDVIDSLEKAGVEP